MKTKMKMFRLLLFVVLAASASLSMAQTNTGDQVVCIGNQPYGVTESTISGAQYHWSITPGVDGVDWHINGNTHSITIDWLLPATYTLSVYTSANFCDGPPQSIQVTVNPNLPVSITISAVGSTTICQGSTVDFTSIVTNGGTSPTYQWLNAGTPIAGATASTYTYTGATAGTFAITCQVTSNAQCATSNPATSNTVDVTVNAQLAVSVTIVPSADDVCLGTTVTYTANPTNGGTSPTYAWTVNAIPVGTNSNTYTYAPAIGDVITCEVLSNLTCATNNPATGTFNPVVKPLPTTSPIMHN